MRQGLKRTLARSLGGGLLVLAGLTAAQARDGASVSVGIAPVLVVPAPVVVPAAMTVPTRAVVVASSLGGQAAPHSAGQLEEAGAPHGRGWHRKPGRAMQGRSPFWQYEAAQTAGTVVVQASPQVWIR